MTSQPTPPPPTGTLDYAHIDRVIPSDALHRIAKTCGAVPLMVGVSIYLLYRITQWQVLPLLGLLMLVVGALMFGVGIICLGWYRYQIAKAMPDDAAGPRRNFRIDLFVLLLNLPAAYFCTTSGFSHVQNDQLVAEVMVTNATGAAIDEFILTVPADGPHSVLSALKPGDSQAMGHKFTRSDARHLNYYIKQGKSVRKGEIPPISDGVDQIDITITDTTVTAKTTVW